MEEPQFIKCEPEWQILQTAECPNIESNEHLPCDGLLGMKVEESQDTTVTDESAVIKEEHDIQGAHSEDNNIETEENVQIGMDPFINRGTQSSVKDGDVGNEVKDKNQIEECGASGSGLNKNTWPKISDPAINKTCTLGYTTRRYACKKCRTFYPNCHELNKHMCNYSEEKQLSCETCGKRFFHINNLKRHMTLHSGPRPFLCDTCGAAFSYSSALKTHLVLHSGQKPFICDTCGVAFNQRCSLLRHVSLHSGVRPYSCETCGASFTTKWSLRGHVLLHIGQMPYSCSLCPMGYTHSSNLKRHMLGHSGQKPFSCDVCGAAFIDKTNLKRHLKARNH